MAELAQIGRTPAERQVAAKPRGWPWLRMLLANPVSAASGVFVLLVALAAIFANALTPTIQRISIQRSVSKGRRASTFWVPTTLAETSSPA